MKTILFIEDEAALQKTFEETLKQEGYKMISALNGEIGLKLANSLAYEKKLNLILLDLILPKINGFEVLKRLKEDKKTKDIPVILLTNLEEIRNVDEAIKLGAATYLVKANYSLKEIVEKIKKALEE